MASSVLASTAAVASAAINRSAPRLSTVAPFTGLKSNSAFPVTRKPNMDMSSLPSNGGRVSCMMVWPPEGLKKFETLSYLRPLSPEQLAREIDYLLRMGWVPCLEFDKDSGYWALAAWLVATGIGTTPSGPSLNPAGGRPAPVIVWGPFGEPVSLGFGRGDARVWHCLRTASLDLGYNPIHIGLGTGCWSRPAVSSSATHSVQSRQCELGDARLRAQLSATALSGAGPKKGFDGTSAIIRSGQDPAQCD